MALDTSALNAEEQAHAQLQKSVAKGGNYRKTKLQVTSDSAVQAKLRTRTCWGRQTPVPVQGGKKIKKAKEKKDKYVKEGHQRPRRPSSTATGREVQKWVRWPLSMRGLAGPRV